MSRMHSARFSIKATSLLCQIKDRSPDPPPAHIMMLIMEPISRRLCHAPVTNLFLARRQHQCVMHSDWQKMKRKASMLFLSHTTLSCRFITFQIKLSFPTTASLFLSWKSAGSVRASSMHPYSMHFIAS